MIIKNESELMALHRAIVEAKFKESHLDPAIPYSGILSDLSERIVTSIIQKLSDNGEDEEAQSWSSIVKLDKNWDGYVYIQSWIKKTDSWTSMSADDKSKYIKVLCSPYQPSKQQESDLIKMGNEHWKT
ncbi:hypothetical protein ACFO4O_15295 [Glaciecola siphonariae]|uniref:Uncharacterized protein n=1 Tax=Glaciecola siphonariae TaxID=521012 RepID=A0ABV9M086_9ALTE